LRLVQAARARLTDAWRSPCPDGRELVVRWRELEHDRDGRRRLALHLQQCVPCRAALAASRAADTRLLAWAALHPAPPSATKRHRLRRFAAVSAVVLALVAALWRAILPDTGTSVPIAEPSASNARTLLWLGSAGPYSVAFDLDTHAWIPFPTRFPADAGAFRLVSPDGRLVATWTPDPPREPRWLDVLQVDGQRLARWRWDSTTLRRPLAWLDATTLLVREIPTRLPYEREAEYLERLQRTSRLLALDVSTRRETTLLHELVTDAIPGPDAGTLAVITAMEPFGPGATSRTVEWLVIAPGSVPHRVARIDGYVGGIGDRPLWLPDRSSLVVSRRPPAAPPSLPTPTELVLVRPDGTVRIVVPHQPGIAVRPLTVAPDAGTLLYLTVPLGQHERAALWELSLVTGDRRPRIRLDRLSGPLAALWTDSGAYLVLVRYIPGKEPASSSIEVTELYRLDRVGASLLGSVPGRWGFDAGGQPLLAPRTSLPSSTSAPLPPNDPLAAGPLALAPGGQWILGASAPGRLALWETRTGTRLTSAWSLQHPTWHPAGMAFYALDTEGHLRLVARSLDGIWQPEPLAFGDGHAAETFLVSAVGPDGRLAALSRASDGSSVLWIGFPPEGIPLRRWPADELVGTPCLVWRTVGHLLIAIPTPEGRLALEELTLGQEGTWRTELVTRLRPFRGQSLERCELAIDPAGHWLAVRAGRDGTDTIHLVPLETPGETLLLDSGPTGAGLAWSPDGSRLAYSLGTKLAVSDRRGQELLQTTMGTPSALVWVQQRALWVLGRDGSDWRLRELALPATSSSSTVRAASSRASSRLRDATITSSSGSIFGSTVGRRMATRALGSDAVQGQLGAR
ncbi:MAG: WD40 repeat domain-containing protein, partial [Thermomicrobium sp.]|nr:WD40 repeat domain-containing protein [Thermomicrobium sp.]